MRSHAEQTRRHEGPDYTYLKLRSLGLDIHVERRRDEYRIVVGSLGSLTPLHAERIMRQVRENEVELARLLLDRPDLEVLAIKTEGRLG